MSGRRCDTHGLAPERCLMPRCHECGAETKDDGGDHPRGPCLLAQENPDLADYCEYAKALAYIVSKANAPSGTFEKAALEARVKELEWDWDAVRERWYLLGDEPLPEIVNREMAKLVTQRRKAEADLVEAYHHIGTILLVLRSVPGHGEDFPNIFKRAAGRESGVTDGDVKQKSGGRRDTVSHKSAPAAAAKSTARRRFNDPDDPPDDERECAG